MRKDADTGVTQKINQKSCNILMSLQLMSASYFEERMNAAISIQVQKK